MPQVCGKQINVPELFARLRCAANAASGTQCARKAPHSQLFLNVTVIGIGVSFDQKLDVDYL